MKIAVGLFCSILVTNSCAASAPWRPTLCRTVFKSKTANYGWASCAGRRHGMAYTILLETTPASSPHHEHVPHVDNFVPSDYTRNRRSRAGMTLAVHVCRVPIYFMFQMVRYTNRLTSWQKLA